MKNSVLVFAALAAAVLSILSQISLPVPSGVPVTLQAFSFALIGYLLLPKLSFYSVLIYLLLGAAGLPVFANFRGGLMHLTGLTGGFLWGSLIFVPLAGLGGKLKKTRFAVLPGLLGLCFFHLAGVLQYAWLTGNSLYASFLLISLPYLAKDVLCVFAACAVGKLVRKRLLKSGIILPDFS